MTTTTLALVACGAPQASEPAPSTVEARASSGDEQQAEADGETSQPSSEFVLQKSDREKPRSEDSELTKSKIKATSKQAALKFTVVDKDKGPIEGIVISLTAPDGKKFYTEETNAAGYAEVLVPVGQKYELVYLSLGRREITASVPVADEPNQNIRLTLRYKRHDPPKKPNLSEGYAEPGLVLEAITFDTGKATIRDESFMELDRVAEYLIYKPSVRIEIAGHTDNKGNPKANKSLSLKRAQAVREYLMVKGVDGDRIKAEGYGDERPIAPNDTEEGRQTNRRIEANEL